MDSITYEHTELTFLCLKKIARIPLLPLYDIYYLHKTIYNTKPGPDFLNDFLDKRSDERARVLRLYKDSPSKPIQDYLKKRDFCGACYKEPRNWTADERNAAILKNVEFDEHIKEANEDFVKINCSSKFEKTVNTALKDTVLKIGRLGSFEIPDQKSEFCLSPIFLEEATFFKKVPSDDNLN